MVLPLLPLFTAGAVSAFGGYVAKDWLSKKSAAPSTVYEAPFHTYAPTSRIDTTKIFAPQYAIQYPTYTIISESPGAKAVTKKEMAAEYYPEFRFQREEAPISGAGAGLQGSEITKMILPAIAILGVAYVAGEFIGKKGKK